MTALIELKDIVKVYRMGTQQVRALDGVSLTVEAGEFVAIVGASGSGKSTLMNLMGCLDRPTSGSYRLSGREVSQLSASELAGVRNQVIGFVFQGFNLLARTSAEDNVALPLIYAGMGKRERTKRARQALAQVGLAGREHHRPNELSGGQQQRVAIARALVTKPKLILADEPTGNLDTRTSVEVMAIFQQLGNQGLTVVLVTHEPDIAAFAKRVIVVRDGKIQSDQPQASKQARPVLPASADSSHTAPTAA